MSTKNNIDVKYSAVAFDSGAEIITKWSDPAINYPSKVANYNRRKLENKNGYPSSGATNYQAALKKVKVLLDTARTDATKIVVFLSDGDPTRYDSNQTYNDRNNNYYYVAGTGSGYDSNALSAAQNILRTLNMNYFYTVGVGPQISYKHLSDLILSLIHI